MAARPITFARRALALQIAVVVLVVGVGLALFGVLLLRELTAQYGERARAVAHAVAADPGIVAAATTVRDGRADPEGVVQERAEAIRRATAVLFVVVTDRAGTRLSHPNPAEIGLPVSTDPSEALAGREVVTVQRGTLGASARAKVPLRDASGAVVGIVSVGIDVNDIQAHWREMLLIATGFAAASLAVGVGGSALLATQLRRQTLGLEPDELAQLVQEREAVLYGIGEGVLALDTADRVTVCNGEARRLLGVEPEIGCPAADLDLPPGVRNELFAPGDATNVLVVTGDRVLVASRRQVRHSGRDLGRVITLRDRTDLDVLTRELDAVSALTEGLRAQRHEFSNRVHTIAGLLELGHADEALEYLHALDGPEVAGLADEPEALTDPYLKALLGAKSVQAKERQVRLSLGEETWLTARLTDPVDVITVLGNLVDNAVEAARLGSTRPAWVEVVLASDGDALHVSVADSGPGVPEVLRERVFESGVTTGTGDSRGIGLALARQTARRRGGEVWLAAPGGSPGGAVFAARLPGVLATKVEVAP